MLLRLTLVALAVSALFGQEQPAQQGPAQQPPAMRTIPDPATPARVGVGITQRKLSLTEAVEMALKNNLDIEIERTNLATAEQSVQAARGFFDPNFRWQPLLQNLNTPTGSILQGSSGRLTDRTFGQNFYLRQRLPNWGTALNLDFENSRITTTNPFTSFSPLINSRLLVGLSQPLIRGLRTDPQRAEIRIRQRRVDLSGVDLELRVIDIITRVEQVYWNLVAVRQDVAVGEDSANLAREQLALNQRLVESGTLARVELAAAEAELQRRLDTWYNSVGLLTDVENNLKQLIAPERVASIWNDEIIPTETNVMEPPNTDDLHAAVATALKRRPELRGLGVRRQINDVEKDLNADLRKPEVNVVANYSLSGIGGTVSTVDNPFTASNVALYERLNQLSIANGLAPVPPPSFGGAPPGLVGSYGTALSNLFGGNYQSFQVGLSIDFNLRNRTADAQYGQSLINEKRLKLEKAKAEQQIEAQVRSALQGIQTARQRIAAANASARAAKEKLDSEQRLFQTGESTNFLVLTRQNEYAESRRREVLSRLEFNRSVAQLEQALGSTLANYNISLR